MLSQTKQGPVYLKAIPRSGGTLFVTMLDAHPSIAMSYEIYEANLFADSGEELNAVDAIRLLEAHRCSDDTQWIRGLPESNFRTFLFRARRAGLSVSEILNELIAFVEKGGDFVDGPGRLDFIESLMCRKALNTNKGVWGGKTQADLYQLHDRNPNAAFFIMVRDIRDVFASMSSKGSFRYTAKDAAELWKTRILEFREFVSRRSPRAMEIRYEHLASEPETLLGDVCQLLGVDYSSEMLRFHEKEMTIFKNPHGHLSNEQIQKGLNIHSIGRWRNDLLDPDLRVIESIAGDLLDE